MTKYFKNVKSLEDLKNQFKALARKNHPDAGGNADTMKERGGYYSKFRKAFIFRFDPTEILSGGKAA